MRSHRAVGGRDGPVVVAGVGVDAAEGDHRLDRDDQAGLHRRSTPSHPVVEHGRVLVHRAPDAVAGVVLEDAECAVAVDVVLDRGAYLVEVPGPRQGGDARPERLLGHPREVLALAHDIGPRGVRNHRGERGVAVPPAELGPAVD